MHLRMLRCAAHVAAVLVIAVLPPPAAAQPGPESRPAAEVRFVDASAAVFADPKDRNYRLAAVVDADADGRYTLLAAGDVEGRAGEFTTRLATMRMAEDGRFRLAPLSLTPKVARFWSCVAGDDVLLCGDLGVCLLKRRGPDSLVEATESAGLGNVRARRAAWVDFDGDGLLDLWLATQQGASLRRAVADGGYEMATEAAGIGSTGDTFDVLATDLDGDGFVDLFASRGHAPVAVHQGRAGGTFSALSAALPAWPQSAWMVAADFENDGRPNVVLVHQDHFMQFNGRYVDPARRDLGGFGPPAVTPLDADNDGWADLLVTLLTDRGQNPLGARLLRNEHGAGFSDVSAAVGFSADTLPDGRALAVFDADNDGDSDVLAFDGVRLVYLRNDGGERNGQLKLRVNRAGGRAALGARVELYDGNLAACNLVNSPVTEIGLGGRKTLAKLRVVWPDGTAEERENVAARPGLMTIERRR
ncbi:FG-GAP repeat protein [Phycisphaerae bacterium RAS1]|nr:FG-GAP repeat protein [Phycisphaerae bacterium RAS1]